MLPPLPEAWGASLGEIGYEVVSTDLQGERQSWAGSPWVEGQLGASVRLLANAYSAVVVTPLVSATGLRLRPAGAVFPLDVESDQRSLRVSWERGAAALLVDRLLAGASVPAVPAGTLDVERVARDMELRGDGDAWSVDAEALLASIVASGGRSWECRRLPSRRVSIPARDLPGWPNAVGYVRDDALVSPVSPTDVGDGLEELVVEAVPVGFHRLFAIPGDAGAPCVEWLDLSVTEGEVVWLTRRAREPP
jgi:hypothetical protein